MAQRTRTLVIAARFLAQPAARVEAAGFVLAAGSRVFVAARGDGPTWTEALVVLSFAVAMPFVEWLVHARLLHAEPIAWRGRGRARRRPGACGPSRTPAQ